MHQNMAIDSHDHLLMKHCEAFYFITEVHDSTTLSTLMTTKFKQKPPTLY